MKNKDNRLELNQIKTSLAIFRKNYNENIPLGFPKASFAVLRKFKMTHPSLFRGGDEWSVDIHRKRLIDWLVCYGAS